MASKSRPRSPISSRRRPTAGETRAPRSPSASRRTVPRSAVTGAVRVRASQKHSTPAASVRAASGRPSARGSRRSTRVGGRRDAATRIDREPSGAVTGRPTRWTAPARSDTRSPAAATRRAKAATSSGGGGPSTAAPSGVSTNSGGPGRRCSPGAGSALPAAMRAAARARRSPSACSAPRSQRSMRGRERVKNGEETTRTATTATMASQKPTKIRRARVFTQVSARTYW